MAEMDLIEQLREKRAFEAALPPTSDEACFTLRRKLMEEQEFREWGKREDDIKRLQNERLNLLQSALVEREKDTEEKHAQRTEEIRLKKTENKERALAKIQRKRIKVLRKMYKARKNVEMTSNKRDIIEEYANYGSTVYAPITRLGLSLDKKANKYEVQPEALSSYSGFQELHNVLHTTKPKVFDSRIDVSKIKFQFKTSLNRKEREHINALAKAQGFINNKNQKSQEEKAKGDDLFNEQLMRPDTPRFSKVGLEINHNMPFLEREKADRKRVAIILLQRLIRGRAA